MLKTVRHLCQSRLRPEHQMPKSDLVSDQLDVLSLISLVSLLSIRYPGQIMADHKLSFRVLNKHLRISPACGRLGLAVQSAEIERTS